MEPVDTHVNPWDEYATEFEQWVARREPIKVVEGGIPFRMLELLGDLGGREVLDAACGEGYFTRLLAARGAHVVGIDLSPRLIAIARAKDPDGTIDYRVADLSRPRPELEAHFDRIASHLALNDVQDYRGFATTLAALARPRGRIVLSFNNPYSSVVRDHIRDYFAPGARGVYGGFVQQGINAFYYHRTLEEYMDAFLGTGLRLVKIADVIQPFSPGSGLLPEGYRFPSFMVLAFDKP